MGDAFGYVANSALNALDVAGAGKLAKAGLKGLGKLGIDWASEAVHATGEWAFSEVTSEIIGSSIGGTAFGTVITDYNMEWVVKAGIGPIGFGSVGRGLGNTALGVHGNSVNSPKPTMVYEHTFQSGKTYTGVGDVNGKRMAQSAKKYGKSDPLVSTKKIIAPDRKTAYGIEHVRIEMNGRAGNISKNYNKRNSPGLKILKAIFK